MQAVAAARWAAVAISPAEGRAWHFDFPFISDAFQHPLGMRKLLLFIVIVGALGFAILRASHTSNSLSANSSDPAPSSETSISVQDFQVALDRISKLEKENEELEKKDHENYPSEIEKTSLDLSVVGTYIAIALTLAAVLVALVSFNRFQDSIRKESREEAVKVVNSLGDYLQGRFTLTTAYVLGQVAWDKNDAYKQVGLAHLPKEAIRYLEISYAALSKSSEPEFKKEMLHFKYQALNNLIFYITLCGDASQAAALVRYALELKNGPDFRKNSFRINTYCRACLKFLKDFSRIQGKEPKAILEEIEDLCKTQENNSLTSNSWTEFDRIKEDLAAAKSANP